MDTKSMLIRDARNRLLYVLRTKDTRPDPDITFSRDVIVVNMRTSTAENIVSFDIRNPIVFHASELFLEEEVVTPERSEGAIETAKSLLGKLIQDDKLLLYGDPALVIMEYFLVVNMCLYHENYSVVFPLDGVISKLSVLETMKNIIEMKEK